MNETDCRLLAEQMGKKWVCCGAGGLDCGDNYTFSTPSEREEVLQWAIKQEGYNQFDKWVWYKYRNEIINWRDGAKPSDYIIWLFSAPKYRFVQLIVDYGKTVLGWTLKGG